MAATPPSLSLRDAGSAAVTAVLASLHASADGLTTAEAQRRAAASGPNVVPHGRAGPLRVLVSQLASRATPSRRRLSASVRVVAYRRRASASSSGEIRALPWRPPHGRARETGRHALRSRGASGIATAGKCRGVSRWMTPPRAARRAPEEPGARALPSRTVNQRVVGSSPTPGANLRGCSHMQPRFSSRSGPAIVVGQLTTCVMSENDGLKDAVPK